MMVIDICTKKRFVDVHHAATGIFHWHFRVECSMTTVNDISEKEHKIVVQRSEKIYK
jgi:hypothetical protein